MYTSSRVRPPRRPHAALYLLSVLAVVMALPVGAIGMAGLVWQTWQHRDSPTDFARLSAGTSYELVGVYGSYGDVWTRVAVGDRFSCTFMSVTTRFGRTFVVPTQHRPRHISSVVSLREADTATLGSFTAPTSGTYRIRCIDSAGQQLDVRARQNPPWWVPVTLCVAIGLILAALVWTVILVRLRARSRLLRTALDTGADLLTG